MISPANLLRLVHHTAPFLFDPKFGFPHPKDGGRLIELGGHPYGWLDILRAGDKLLMTAKPTSQENDDYFALCLACHHATVATFIPTDVDRKIRGTLWQQPMSNASRRCRFDLVLNALSWDLSRISTRTTELAGVGPVSGHNGEMLGVMAGALGSFIQHQDSEYANKAAEAIDAELNREAYEFKFALTNPGQEIDVLQLAMSLTHNCGDLDQGISFWARNPIYDSYRLRFGRLAHENEPYGGIYPVAAKLYRHLLSAEGHRHYPLREVVCLRASPDFLLPLGPFFDTWGERIATHPALSMEDRVEVLTALLRGCKKIKGQVGYYRAISGFAQGAGTLDKFASLIPSSIRHMLNEPEIKRQVGISKASFESSLRKRMLKLLVSN